MKIILAGIEQETNSFSPVVCTMDYFKKGGIYEGEALINANTNQPTAIGGMLEKMRIEGAQVIPAISMRSQSNGPVDPSVADFFIEKLHQIIKQSQPVDGIFFAMHGGMQITDDDDGVGLILEWVRNLVGQDTVIACSTDLHANITRRMMKNADVICGYNTYPHVDFYETGFRAATMGMMCFNDSVRPIIACVKIPMISPAEGYDTINGPFKDLMGYADEMRKNGQIIDFSIYQMQPWLDVTEGGSAVIVAAADRETAEKVAVDLAEKQFDIRKQMETELYALDDVIDIAVQNKTEMPVIVIDSADSTNAGASGDSPAVIKRLLERNTGIKSAAVINDADAVEKAFKVGVGNSGNFSLGGTLHTGLSKPLYVRARVKSLHDGIFLQEGPAGRGLENDIGRTAVLQIGNIDVVVCQYMKGNGDPQLYRAFGIEPSLYRLVVVKSATQYKTAYQKFTSLCYPVDTPGAASAKLKSLPFKKLPRPFYPLDDIETFHPEVLFARE